MRERELDNPERQQQGDGTSRDIYHIIDDEPLNALKVVSDILAGGSNFTTLARLAGWSYRHADREPHRHNQ